jgi:hypothetical protein
MTLRSVFRTLIAVSVGAAAVSIASAQTSEPSRVVVGQQRSTFGRSSYNPMAPNAYSYRFARDWAGEYQSYRDALRFASCVARFNKELVRSAAIMDAGKPEGLEFLQQVSRRNPGCATNSGAVSASVLHAAFFETAFKNGYLGASPAGLGVFLDQDREVAIGRCQFDAAPQSVQDVLRTEPESEAEAAAVQKLLSETRSCGRVTVTSNGATVWRLALLEAAARSRSRS